MSQSQRSWGAFTKDFAADFLKTIGSPSMTGRELLVDVIGRVIPPTGSVLDLGCGNAQLYEYMQERRLGYRYTGVDFSESLLDAARTIAPGATFVRDDVGALAAVQGRYDAAVYSHVVEILESPELSLRRASELARFVIIRFFEPPEFEVDSVELRELEVGDGVKVPYLRRKMSRDYYRLILARIGCVSVDVYRDALSRDQVHVLHFAGSGKA